MHVIHLAKALVAQTVAVDPSLPWWAQSWFLGLVTIVTTVLIPVAKKLLNEHWKAAKKSNIDDTVFDVVSSFGEMRVNGIKAAAKDGSISPEEKDAQLKATLEDAINAILDREGGAVEVARASGVTPTQVRELLEGKVERVVTARKPGN